MGANVSKSQSEILNKTINKTINNFTSTVENNSSAKAISKQNMTVIFENAKCETVAVTQISSVKLNIINENQNDLTKDIAQAFKSKADAIAKNVSEQENTGLNAGSLNISEVKSKIDNYIENNIENNITNSLKSTFQSDATSDQNITFIAKRFRGKLCTIDQKSAVENISRNIVTNVVKEMVKNLTESETTGKTDNKNKQKNEGVDIMAPLKMLGTVYIAAGVCVFILLIWILYSIFG